MAVLCPSDAVIPYRLEMQTKLETENATDLYHFWNNQLYQALYCKFEKDSPKELINLASAEYSKAILPYKNIRCITCIFGERGKRKNKKSRALRLRSPAAKWYAGWQIRKSKAFRTSVNSKNWDIGFSPSHSTEDTYTFSL